jgi:hypothetical protein
MLLRLLVVVFLPGLSTTATAEAATGMIGTVRCTSSQAVQMALGDTRRKSSHKAEQQCWCTAGVASAIGAADGAAAVYQGYRFHQLLTAASLLVP